VLSRYTGPSLSEAVRPLIAEVDRRTEVARIYWASPVVDSLAAVFGGDAVRVFKDLASWTTGTKVYIALRLCRTMAAGGKFADVMNTAADVMNSDSDADVTNTALLGPGGPSGPEEKSVQLPSLRSLAAARFLEFVVASIRGEVDPTAAEITQMQVAGTILRELAPLSGPGLDDLDGLDGLSNKRTAPRPRPVDSTLPKGFPGTCGPGNHAITYKPMLLLEIKRGRDTRLASIVSNEAYGSGPISMFTAAQEIRRLLLLGPLTKVAWREVPEDATVLLSASVHYFPYKNKEGKIVRSPGCPVHFGKTEYYERGESIECVSFVKSHLLYALERPDIARILFSPHYNRSCKALSFALIKIKLSIFPPASQRCAHLVSLRRAGRVRTLDYLRKMVERKSQSQSQGKGRRPRFFEGQVLFR